MRRRAGTQKATRHSAATWAPALQRTVEVTLRCVRGTGQIHLACLIQAAPTVSHSRGVFRPSFALAVAPESAEGAGKAGCRLAPAVHCAKLRYEKLAQRHTGEAQHPAFPAQWFDGLCRALPGERCTIAPVALRMADVAGPVGPQHHRRTWRTDPGRQDHTILPYAGCTGRVRARFAHGVTRPANHRRADAASVHHVPSRVS